MVRCKRLFILCCTLVMAVAVSSSLAADEGIKGWEQDSEYNNLYKVSELDRLKGNIQKIIDIKPMKGMAPGIGLILKDGDGDKVTVHVGPTSFLGKNIGLKRGDRVKIRGAWAEINDEDIFMAAKIKKGDYFVLKVRLTKDGKPFWVMSPEELTKERASQ